MAINGIKSDGTSATVITDGTTHVHDAAYSRWKVVSEGGMSYLTTDVINPADTDAEIVSPGIPGALINGSKIVVGFNTTTAGANEASDFHLDGSIDGKNWVMIGSSLDDDTEPNVAGVQLHAVDLTSYQLPWYRLSWNDGNDDLTTWEGVFFVGGLAGGVDEGSVGVGGVGADPS